MPARYLALGDSYTAGEGVAAADSFPFQLARMLRERGASVSDPIVVARTGWTTAELLDAVHGAALEPHFDLVTLGIGVNDQYRGRAPEDYRADLRRVLSEAAALAEGRPGRVVVVSIPDWSVTPFARDRDPATVGRAIAEFNRVNLEESERHETRWVDVTEISRTDSTPRGMLADDGLHPSGAMYRLWAEAMIATAREALGD